MLTDVMAPSCHAKAEEHQHGNSHLQIANFIPQPTKINLDTQKYQKIALLRGRGGRLRLPSPPSDGNGQGDKRCQGHANGRASQSASDVAHSDAAGRHVLGQNDFRQMLV